MHSIGERSIAILDSFNILMYTISEFSSLNTDKARISRRNMISPICEASVRVRNTITGFCVIIPHEQILHKRSESLTTDSCRGYSAILFKITVQTNRSKGHRRRSDRPQSHVLMKEILLENKASNGIASIPFGHFVLRTGCPNVCEAMKHSWKRR